MPAGALLRQTGARLSVLLQQSRTARQRSRFPYRRGTRSEREKRRVRRPVFTVIVFHVLVRSAPPSSFLTSFLRLPFRPAPESGTDHPGRASGGTGIPEDAEREERNNSTAPRHTAAPKPAPRITPPPERVRTQAYLPPELPPLGDARVSVPTVSDDGIIYVMTPQAGK